MKKILVLITGIILTSIFVNPAAATISFSVESGQVSGGYNDVRIPNETGTLFSLTDDFDLESKAYYRLTVSYDINEKHHISALFAPLSLDASGTAGKDIMFNDSLFTSGTDLTAKYTFNSYRLTYRYTLVNNDKFRFGLGFTGKIRDAAIKVEENGRYSEKTNVGFVPLVNFSLKYMLSPRISLLLEGDALASPGGQGRAEDVLAAVNFGINNYFNIYAGYRILEGGADVDEVYNFALLNYLAVGISGSF